MLRQDEPERCGGCPFTGAGPRRRLTPLDATILEAVAAGASSLRIARGLRLSRQAVDYHVKSLQRRLNAGNRAELVARACATGVLGVDQWPPKVSPCPDLGHPRCR
ncbi:DNA-binding CsgD family transcriptional regulator [Umezawaea tangerina]|uniref:DNA-binding CsgD family transcriptional regulator n=1 Tax=Umezawaea tangerina TaxID=84725 RepID=A0A2T0SUC6_9PSEU|nr:DNA-binding CsgD family transcriptional regulator [Umezawaea tangerina]